MEFTHHVLEDGTDVFETDACAVNITNGIFPNRLTLTEGNNKVWLLLRGWQQNWLAGNADFCDEAVYQDNEHGRTASRVARQQGIFTFSDANTFPADSIHPNTIYQITLPDCLVHPVVHAMVKQGLVLPSAPVPTSKREESLAATLLKPR